MMSMLSNDVNRLEQSLNDGMNSLVRLVVMVLAIAVLIGDRLRRHLHRWRAVNSSGMNSRCYG